MHGLKTVRSRRNDALTRVSWDRLEVMLADHYRGHGWQVDHIGTGGSGARFDGGIDLKLRRPGEFIVVQCKHWNVKQVPHNAVHELLGIMVTEGASGAILVTSGEFTRYAVESAAKGGHVQLIDGDALRDLLGAFSQPEALSAPATLPIRFSEQVGERLLAATEDRIRHGVGARRTAEQTVTHFALKAGLLLLAVWLIVTLSGRVLNTAVSGLSSRQSTSHAQPVTKLSAGQPTTRLALPQSRTAPSGVDDAAIGNSCHEMIDVRSGTSIDRCASPLPQRRQSEAEIRASQRKADEAAAILAPYVPEI